MQTAYPVRKELDPISDQYTQKANNFLKVYNEWDIITKVLIAENSPKCHKYLCCPPGPIEVAEDA